MVLIFLMEKFLILLNYCDHKQYFSRFNGFKLTVFRM